MLDIKLVIEYFNQINSFKIRKCFWLFCKN